MTALKVAKIRVIQTALEELRDRFAMATADPAEGKADSYALVASMAKVLNELDDACSDVEVHLPDELMIQDFNSAVDQHAHDAPKKVREITQ